MIIYIEDLLKMSPVYLVVKRAIQIVDGKNYCFWKKIKVEKNVDVNNIQYQFYVMGKILNSFENALPLWSVGDRWQVACSPTVWGL